jgi:hypothetical protein
MFISAERIRIGRSSPRNATLRTIFRIENDFVQPWLRGFSSPVFSTYWKYLDIDLDRRK